MDKISLNNKKIVFLCYLNRSGSTLLAKKLSVFKEVGVGIECELIDGYNRGNVNIETIEQLNDYLNSIYSLPKFKYWELDRQDLFNILITLGFPLKFRDFLIVALIEHFKPEKPTTLIHKSELYHLYFKKINGEFQNAKFIYIDRDPRAIFNSQKKSIGSTSKKPMIDEPEKFARKYKRSQKVVNQNIKKSNFLKITYEDFIRNEESLIAGIINFLGIKKEYKNRFDYFQNIPDEQRHLHENIKKSDLLTERIDAWKNELTKKDIYILQVLLKKNIKQNGYSLVDINFWNLDDKIYIIKKILKHYTTDKISLFIKNNNPKIYFALGKIIKKYKVHSTKLGLE